ncbi:MAG: hypothetical protein DCC67_17645 [Planctomycetota bacterium]|nr:MAG: hypothetical protein DCC67_17645 [Planctomycetota bacterium]
MNSNHGSKSSYALSAQLGRRLGAYLAAAAGAGAAGEAQAAIVANTTVQPFGVNGDVNIDFNSDGQIDFQIDHDRVDLGGGNVVDYLQLDKNDVNSAVNPLPFDPITGGMAQTFPPGATVPNDQNEAAYVIAGPQGSYPAALTLGAPIGPASTFDYQEGGNFQGGGKAIRANRLIDEDATQVDQVLGGLSSSAVYVPTNGPNWLGLGGETRYLGVKMDLNNSNQINYGWIGVRIDSEADATGAVVGYAYETTPGAPIGAGVVPEPGSIMLALAGVAAAVGGRRRKRARGVRPA